MICFISGHLNLTQAEFDLWYKPEILKAHSTGAKFVVGDARGCDNIAQKFLTTLPNADVTVYHMFDKPRTSLFSTTKGGFSSDEERDMAMTRFSTHDILWIRPPEEQKKILGKKYDPTFITGTEKNLLRRNKDSSLQKVEILQKITK